MKLRTTKSSTISVFYRINLAMSVQSAKLFAKDARSATTASNAAVLITGFISIFALISTTTA